MAQVIIEEGESNQRLNDIGPNIKEALSLLINSHCGVSTERRLIIKPKLATKFARALSSMDGEDNPKEPFGVDLVQRVKLIREEDKIFSEIFDEPPKQAKPPAQQGPRFPLRPHPYRGLGVQYGLNHYQGGRFI